MTAQMKINPKSDPKVGGAGTLLLSQDKQTKPQNRFFKLPNPTPPPQLHTHQLPVHTLRIKHGYYVALSLSFAGRKLLALNCGEMPKYVFHVLSKQTKSGTQIGNRKKCENSSGQMLPFSGVICCIIYLPLRLRVG